jgi:hypothetical protein
MKNLHFLILSCAVLLLCSCEDDFIEDDLTGKMVTILAPADNDTVSTSTPLYWWSEIDGARSYRIQIVYPDFNAPQQLLYDTAVVGDRFYPSLSPGNSYHWRIRPENGSSEGEWITRRITVDSSVSLSAQTVIITQPSVNNTATANSTMLFTWNSVAAASLYRIELTNLSTGALITSTTTTLNSYSVVLAQGNYEFRVRAENSSSITAWSSRLFTIDQTAPTIPVLVFPADNAFYASAPGSITFDWTSSSDAYTDSLEIATDSTFASGIALQLQLSASQGFYTWTGAQSSTTYFWRVRSQDLAGNRSNNSAVFRVIVN